MPNEQLVALAIVAVIVAYGLYTVGSIRSNLSAIRKELRSMNIAQQSDSRRH